MEVKQLMGDLETIKHKNLIKLGKHLSGGDSVIFTKTESDILLILMNNFGKKVSIADICGEIFGWDLSDVSHTFRVHIHRIRKGLERIDDKYVLSYVDGYVTLTYLKPLNKIEELKNSLHALLSNEEGLSGKDEELLSLLSKN
jgi:DNA-binding response OmpR family regulator